MDLKKEYNILCVTKHTRINGRMHVESHLPISGKAETFEGEYTHYRGSQRTGTLVSFNEWVMPLMSSGNTGLDGMAIIITVRYDGDQHWDLYTDTPVNNSIDPEVLRQKAEEVIAKTFARRGY